MEINSIYNDDCRLHVDDFGSVEELSEMRMDGVKKELVDGGWKICPICNEAFAELCSNGLCVECDYKKKHPDAQKKYCEQCIHFFYHDLYDENNHTECCCCKLHLEGKNRGEWSYLCDDFVKCETAEQHEIYQRAERQLERVAASLIEDGFIVFEDGNYKENLGQ